MPLPTCGVDDMPRYDYRCPKCGYVHEVSVKVDWRDKINLDCPDDGAKLERLPAAGMAVVWAGKFQSPSLKKTAYDGEVQW